MGTIHFIISILELKQSTVYLNIFIVSLYSKQNVFKQMLPLSLQYIHLMIYLFRMQRPISKINFFKYSIIPTKEVYIEIFTCGNNTFIFQFDIRITKKEKLCVITMIFRIFRKAINHLTFSGV